MAKRWTEEDDRFLVAYFETLGDYIGEHDLGRPKGAATKRVKVLRETGAWDVLKLIEAAEAAYMIAIGQTVVFFGEQEMQAAQQVLGIARRFANPASVIGLASPTASLQERAS